MHEEQSKELAEYKLFCFDGKVKIILVCKGEAHSDVYGSRTNDFMDDSFQRIPVQSLNPNSEGDLICPKEMKQMMLLAEELSNEVPLLRVDFYLVGNQIFFGELTFFHNSGFCKFKPEKYDKIFGSYITLPESKI